MTLRHETGKAREDEPYAPFSREEFQSGCLVPYEKGKAENNPGRREIVRRGDDALVVGAERSPTTSIWGEIRLVPRRTFRVGLATDRERGAKYLDWQLWATAVTV